MTETFKSGLSAVHRPTTIIAITLLAGLCGQARAQDAGQAFPLPNQGAGFDSQANTAGRSVVTSRGPAFVTGHVGSWETTTIPGGLLMNNGNGTSTLTVPGGVPQTVATPR
jgi:hypothetical protein